MTFEDWMKKVDKAVNRLSGGAVGVSALPDMCFRDRYDDEVSPGDVARELLEEEGFPFED